jgi:hypothetical protein
MITYGFYNSISGDRLYNAEQMSSLFEGMIHDGVFEDIGDAFAVSAGIGMNVKVGTGRAWFNKTWTKNDSDLNLSIDSAEVILKRIDVVVLEIDASVEVRENSIKIIKGTPSSTPEVPTLTNTENVHQYALALISIDASVVEVVTGDITNKVGTVDCPYVTGVLKNVDTNIVDNLIDQFNILIGEFNAIEEYVNNTVVTLDNKTTVVTTSGSGNAYIVDYAENIPLSYDGLIGIIKANFTNTGAATINFNSLGVKNIKKQTVSGKTSLSSGDIIGNGIYTVAYDGVDIILVTPTTISSSIGTAQGDLVKYSAGNTPERFPKGASNFFLGVNNDGSDIEYRAASNNGTFSNTTANVPASGTYELQIPLGINANKGSVQLQGIGSSNNGGTIVYFTKNSSEAHSMGSDTGGTTFRFYRGSSQLSEGYFMSGNTNVFLKSARINGSNLELVFQNTAGTDRTLYVYGSWEVFI